MMNEKKLMIFKNEEFGQVRTIEINGNIYFAGTDVAKALGYAIPSKAVNTHCRGVVKYLIPTNGGVQQINFINKNDLYRIISFSRTKTSKYKNKFINWLILENLISNNDFLLISSRKEIEFIESLTEALIPFNISGIKQYEVLNYRIDYYIPDLKVAIEYDENNHSGYTYEQQEGRQKEIEKELNCKFIRVNDKKSNAYNIGYILNKLMKGMVA